jgi:hypothetical protein
MADEKQQGFGDPFQEAEQNPLPVKQTLWERLNTGSGIPMVDEALKRDFTQKQAQANLYHQNAAQLNGLLMHLGTPKGKSYINPQTGAAYSEDDISQLKLQRDHAWGQYEKLVGVDKESKGALQKAKSIIDFMHGSRGRMAPPPTPEYQSSVSDAGVSTGGINAPRQGPVARPGDYATNISDVGGVQYDPSVAQKLTPPPLSPLQEAVRGSTQLPFATHQAKVQQFGLDTNALQSMGVQGRRALVKQMDMDETKPYIQDFILTGKITGNMAASLRPPPRPAGSYTTSVLDARSRASKGGEIFLDSHGNPIDLDNLDDSMGLKGMQVANQDTGKWEVRYEPYSPSQSTVTVGNEVYAVSPMDKSKLVTGAGAALGPHNVPSTSIHTAPGVTLGGEIGTVTTGTTKVPSTVGISGRTGSATPTGPVGRQGGISAPPTPQAPAATRKSGAASIPIASTAPRGKGNEQAIPFGAANQLNQRIIPVREAATQLFGDPSQPDFKGFQEYASLADDKNKDEREALANAVRLTLDHMKGE